MGKRVYDFDAELLLKDAGLVAASARAQVDGANKSVDLGAGRIDGTVVLDVDAIEIASNNEKYDVVLLGSAAAGLTSPEVLAQRSFGATEVQPGGAIDSVAGRYEMPFTNEQNGVIYPFVGLYTVVAGTIATGINYRAFIAKQAGR